LIGGVGHVILADAVELVACVGTAVFDFEVADWFESDAVSDRRYKLDQSRILTPLGKEEHWN
jgi:hypothetical protein